MNTFVLILVIAAGAFDGGVAVTPVHGFPSREACLKAGEDARTKAVLASEKRNYGWAVTVSYSCAPVVEK